MEKRLGVGLLIAALLGGCAFKPPPPKRCEGEFRPINTTQQSAVESTARNVDSVAMCKGGNHGNA
jgi:hypothetical protein